MYRFGSKRVHLIRPYTILASFLLIMVIATMIFANAFNKEMDAELKKQQDQEMDRNGIDLDPRIAAQARVIRRQLAKNPSRLYLSNKKMYDEILEFAANGGQFKTN